MRKALESAPDSIPDNPEPAIWWESLEDPFQAAIPGVLLEGWRAKNLREMLNQQGSFGTSSSNCAEPEIGLVFYDSARKPVNQVAISLSCMKFIGQGYYFQMIREKHGVTGMSLSAYTHLCYLFNDLFEFEGLEQDQRYDPLDLLFLQGPERMISFPNSKWRSHISVKCVRSWYDPEQYVIDAITVTPESGGKQYDLSLKDKADLSDFSLEGMEVPWPDEGSEKAFIQKADLNFDGYADLILPGPNSDASGTRLNVYLYYKGPDKFIFHEGLSTVCDLAILEEEELTGGICKGVEGNYNGSYYGMNSNGEMVLSRKVNQFHSRETGLYTLTIQNRINNIWKTESQTFESDQINKQ